MAAAKPKPDDSDAQTLTDVQAQQEAQAIAHDAAAQAAAEGASPTEARAAAREAVDEALKNYRLHDEDVDRIAKRQVEVLREAGAFEPASESVHAPPPAAGAPAAGEGAPPAPPVDPQPGPLPPEQPAEPPRKLSRAERFAGVDV